MNNQPPEQRLNLYAPLNIQEIFLTLQGEGPFSGSPAVFVRLAGCNLQCPGCDTDYTSKRHDKTIFEILEEVGNLFEGCFCSSNLVVITGGEPFRQPHVQELICKLLDEGYYVQVETNGTLQLPLKLVNLASKQTHLRTGLYVIVSPKTGSVHPSIEEAAAAYKYVIDADSVASIDGLPLLALGHSAKPKVARPPWLSLSYKSLYPQNPRPQILSRIYIQAMDVPFDETGEKSTHRNIVTCIEVSLKFGYTFQLQLHKSVGLP